MNYVKGIALYIAAMIVMAFIVAVMGSCDTAKRQAYHYNKFIKFGGKIDTVERVITVEKVVKGKDGKDSIVYIDVPVKCPEATVTYKDRWHIRRMDKQERDSLRKAYKHSERMLKLRASFVEDSLHRVIQLEKAKKKTAKAERGSCGWANPWIWVLLAAMCLASIYLIKRG